MHANVPYFEHVKTRDVLGDASVLDQKASKA